MRPATRRAASMPPTRVDAGLDERDGVQGAGEAVPRHTFWQAGHRDTIVPCSGMTSARRAGPSNAAAPTSSATASHRGPDTRLQP